MAFVPQTRPTNRGIGTINVGTEKTLPGFETHDVINEVKKHLSSLDRFHGALTERVCLCGSPGSGKRRIAVQAAREITVSDGRRLLTVEAGTSVDFIRGYFNLYFILTGETLPIGLGVPLSLTKIKYMLEQRRQEWLLVLLGVAPFMDSSNNNVGQKLRVYLPDRGQVIMTSSEAAFRSSSTSDTAAPRLICTLELAAGARSISVPKLVLGKHFYEYGRQFCPAMLEASEKALRRMFGTDGTVWVLFTITAANLRLLNLSFEAYAKMHNARTGKRHSTNKPKAHLIASFDASIRILWDALADRDGWVLKLLAVMAMADPIDTPLDLLQKLPVFQNTVSDRFSGALDLLLSLQLVEIALNGDECRVVKMPQHTYNWVRRHIRHAYSDKEFSSLVHSWIEVLTKAIGEDPSDDIPKAERWWSLQPLIWCIVNARGSHVIASRKMLEFIVYVAELIIEDRRLPYYAGIFIDEAYKIWTSLRGEEFYASGDAESYFIRIKHVRSRAYLCVSECMLAEQDLRAAKNALYGMKPQSARTSPELQRRTEELEIRVLIAQERYVEAEKLLDQMLDDPEPEVLPVTIAQRHHWMAVVLFKQNLDVAALQHSHCTMKYWAEQPQEVKGGITDVTMLTWVDRHASLLISLQKYRGALLFLPKLFDAWSEHVPYGSTLLWRLAHELVLSYASIDNVAEAEKVTIRMLEMSPVNKTHGEGLFYCLHLLHELGVLYSRFGRNVEAEGIYRFNLRVVKVRDIKPWIAVHGDKIPPDWWTQLVVVLNLQGRQEEARRIRDEYQDEITDEKFMDSFLKQWLRKHSLSQDLYQRAMWAEEEGMLKQWKMMLRNSGEVKERSAYRRAVLELGTVTKRVRENLPIEHEIDFHLCARARKSKLLHLLDNNLVFMSFASKFFPSPDPDEEAKDEAKQVAEEVYQDDWLPPRQHLIEEYLHFCECRRHRQRSASIDPVELIDKRFIRQSAAAEEEPKVLKQLHITDFFFVMLERPPHLPCPEDCPCRDAALRGEAEYADMEYKLWDCDESLRPPAHPRLPLGPQPVIKTTALLPDELFIQEKDKKHWRWVRTELTAGEGPDENYIVPLSLSIPILTITPPEGQEELTEVTKLEELQSEITKYFQREYARDMMMREMKEEYHQPHRLEDIFEDDENQVGIGAQQDSRIP